MIFLSECKYMDNTRCIRILAFGPNKGNQCKNKCIEGKQLCGIHFRRNKGKANKKPEFIPEPEPIPELESEPEFMPEPEAYHFDDIEVLDVLEDNVPTARVLLYCHGRAMEITPKIMLDLKTAADLLGMNLPHVSQFESINITETAQPTIMANPDRSLPAEYHGKFDIVYDVNCDNSGWATLPKDYKLYTKPLYVNMLNALKNDNMALILSFMGDIGIPALSKRILQWKVDVLNHITLSAAPTKGYLNSYENRDVYILYKRGVMDPP